MGQRVWAIAINTFREAVRDKVLYGVLGLSCAVLLLSLALAELSLHQQRKVVLDVGLASISLFSVVIAVFLGSSLLYKEIERKTLYVILPKPIRRWEFLLGKYVGIAITAVVFIAIMGAIQLWVTSVQAGAPPWMVAAMPSVGLAALGLAMWRVTDRTAVLLPWSLAFLAAGAGVGSASGVEVVAISTALLLTLAEVLLLSAVALLFSSFSTPFLTGALSLGVWLVGRSADEMEGMRSQALGDGVKEVMHVLGRVVPNFHLFVPGRHALTGEVEFSGGLGVYLGTTVAYGLAYSAVLLLFAAAIFQRRDFL